MSDSGEGENEIRRRAAWMLAMLAVVAGLLVLLMTTVFNTSGGGGSNNDGTIADPYSSASSSSSAVKASPSPRKPSAPSTTATSSGPVPTPSCPGSSICAVKGDLAGATAAINKYRSENGMKPITATITPTAEKCAVSNGNDCPSAFVWVHVDSLSGTSLVNGVKGFNSGQELLNSSATTYQLGWAYDPQSKTSTCAVIRGS